MKIKDMPDFNRKESHFHMQNMIDGFLTYFQDRSCIKHDPVKISSGIDPSVRFIGSHISVLKPYFLNDSIPAGGCYSFQNVTDKEYTAGIHADVDKNTDMKVFIYDGKDTEPYTK